MRYPRDQCKLVSDRLPTRDAAHRQSSHAGLAHRHIHEQMDGGHHPDTARQGYSTRTSRAAKSDEEMRPTRGQGLDTGAEYGR